MKIGRALLGFTLLSSIYFGALLWANSKNELLNQFYLLMHAIPILMTFSFSSYIVRYLRWHWLLKRSGNQVSWAYGFFAYLAGFAFTATPGKAGELIRVRYLLKVGVPANVSFGAFVYERVLDLMVVLLLASLTISNLSLLILAYSFVTIFISLMIVLVCRPNVFTYLSKIAHKWGFIRLEKIIFVIRDGLLASRIWFTPLDLLLSLVCGFLAWGLASYSFVWLLGDLNVPIDFSLAFSIYPLAMLAGAASMLPGGIGSTELTIIFLLSLCGAPTHISTLAAVGVSFSTIWFAVLVGFISLGLLELEIFWRRSRE